MTRYTARMAPRLAAAVAAICFVTVGVAAPAFASVAAAPVTHVSIALATTSSNPDDCCSTLG